MGGGGAMRSAMKAATVGAINGKLRPPSTLPLSDHSVSALSRNPSRDPSRSVSTGIASATAIDDATAPVTGKSERWEFEDWEFAEEGLNLGPDSPRKMSRVVFGGVPTMEEAEEAASDLKGILETEYFPSTTRGCQNADIKDVQTYSSISNPAIQAFKLLKENAEAQNIVSSLACDEKIWHCVMSNERVLEFIKSQATDNVASLLEEELKPENDPKPAEDNFDNRPDWKDSDGGTESGFAKLMLRLKMTVNKIVGRFSELIQNFFAVPTADDSADAKVGGPNTANEISIGNSIMALAVMVIVVLVMKRA
ncbi:hypothetical protein Sjap_025372 [Stephania japonica]|uniref:Uncharacterized protein n=1 Tax=Stephania japonica TaxID=461633 RepID=A0AAP0HHW4_9MAGN